MRARQPRLTGLSTGTCSAVAGGLVDAGGDVNDGEDDVLHKVHVMLHTRMDTIRVQVQTQQTNVFVIVFSQSGMGIRGEFFLQRIVWAVVSRGILFFSVINSVEEGGFV